jgi:citryl-CoA lyase
VELKKQGKITKPIVAYIAGRFTERLKKGTRFGHAGAFIEGERGKPSQKIKVLEENGIKVARYHDQLVDIVKEVCANGIPSSATENVVTHELGTLVKESTFSETIFLLLTGRKPTEKERQIFEKMLICIIDHGAETTSSATSRFIISGGNDINVGVGGGILSIGDFHGGAIENAMKFFYELAEKSIEERRQIIAEKISHKEIIFGFGHKVYKDEDPRVTLLKEECQRIGFTSRFFSFLDDIEHAFQQMKGKTIPVNIDGFIAAVLCEMNVDYRLGKGIFIIGRTPGLVWQCYDELTSGKKVRRLKE